eukprot:58531-Amphidinium_carterae.1
MDLFPDQDLMQIRVVRPLYFAWSTPGLCHAFAQRGSCRSAGKSWASVALLRCGDDVVPARTLVQDWPGIRGC